MVVSRVRPTAPTPVCGYFCARDDSRGATTTVEDFSGPQQPQQQQHSFAGAEDVAERLAGGERLKSTTGNSSAGVFYNRVGAISRDLSVLMANVLAEERMAASGRTRKTKNAVEATTAASVGEDSSGARTNAGDGTERNGLVVLDAFAASGVRALRYLTEVPGVRRVVANDHDLSAIDMMRRAADACGAGDKLEIHHGDALDTMYAARSGGLGTYDVIDIDPYGCAAGYLDAAVEAVTDGGLLCITSTDMPILSGSQPAVAYSRYGSIPTRAGYHDEMSLRILLHATSAAAGRHRRSIKPVLSVAVDHYVRVFVRVFRSPKEALISARNHVSYVLQSEMCPSFFLLPAIPAKKTSKSHREGNSSIGQKTAAATNQPVPKMLPSATGTRSLRGRSESEQEALTESTAAMSVSASSLGDGTRAASEKQHTQGEVDRLQQQRQQMPPCVGDDATMKVAADFPGPGGTCPETGGALMLGGPIWSGPLHDEAWVERAIALASLVSTTTLATPSMEEPSNGSPNRWINGCLPVEESKPPSESAAAAAEAGVSERQGKHGPTSSVVSSFGGTIGQTCNDSSGDFFASALEPTSPPPPPEPEGGGHEQGHSRVASESAPGLRREWQDSSSSSSSSSNNARVDQDPMLDIDRDCPPPLLSATAAVPKTTTTATTTRPRLVAGARAESLLRAVSWELNDTPLFYHLGDMFATVGLARHPKREQVMGALEAAGYRTSGMHKEPLALKTDAPDVAVWDVLRCWLRDNPQAKPPGRPAGVSIIERGPQLIDDADFDAAERVGLKGNGDKGMAPDRRGFLHATNPERRWGPLSRGTVMASEE